MHSLGTRLKIIDEISYELTGDSGYHLSWYSSFTALPSNICGKTEPTPSTTMCLWSEDLKKGCTGVVKYVHYLQEIEKRHSCFCMWIYEDGVWKCRFYCQINCAIHYQQVCQYNQF